MSKPLKRWSFICKGINCSWYECGVLIQEVLDYEMARDERGQAFTPDALIGSGCNLLLQWVAVIPGQLGGRRWGVPVMVKSIPFTPSKVVTARSSKQTPGKHVESPVGSLWTRDGKDPQFRVAHRIKVVIAEDVNPSQILQFAALVPALWEGLIGGRDEGGYCALLGENTPNSPCVVGRVAI
eukprot:12660969-Ditylum_brightwellii.AAC.1